MALRKMDFARIKGIQDAHKALPFDTLVSMEKDASRALAAAKRARAGELAVTVAQENLYAFKGLVAKLSRGAL